MKFQIGFDKKEAKERVNNNDLVNHEYIMQNSNIGDKFSVPENLVDEFTAILLGFCKLEKV